MVRVCLGVGETNLMQNSDSSCSKNVEHCKPSCDKLFSWAFPKKSLFCKMKQDQTTNLLSLSNFNT